MVKNILKTARHFLFNKNASKNLKDQFALRKVLKPYFATKHISKRTSFIHIFSYLSAAFKNDEKLRILMHHYSFLNKAFNRESLHQLFTTGIECHTESDAENKYSIVLCFSSMLEFEGSLSLVYKVNDKSIAHISFSIASGKLFKLADKDVLFIACLQKNAALQSTINMATKHFKDIDPGRILMKVLEAVANTLSITTCIGVSAANQLTAIKHAAVEKFHPFYDQFWIDNGGYLKNGDYIITLPLFKKAILDIKQTHRNRTLKKRERLQQLYDSAQQNMQHTLLKNSQINNYPLYRAS